MSDIKKTANKVRSKLKSECLPAVLLGAPSWAGSSRRGAVLPCSVPPGLSAVQVGTGFSLHKTKTLIQRCFVLGC